MDSETLSRHLDKVDPATVARTKNYIPNLIKLAPAFTLPILELINESGSEPPLRRPQAITDRVLAAKREPRRQVNPIVASAIWNSLCAQEVLPKIEDPDTDRPRAGGHENIPLFAPDSVLERLWHIGGQYRRLDLEARSIFEAKYSPSINIINSSFHSSILTVDKTDQCSFEKVGEYKLRDDNMKHFCQHIVDGGRFRQRTSGKPGLHGHFPLGCTVRLLCQVQEDRTGSLQLVSSIFETFLHFHPCRRLAAFGSIRSPCLDDTARHMASTSVATSCSPTLGAWVHPRQQVSVKRSLGPCSSRTSTTTSTRVKAWSLTDLNTASLTPTSRGYHPNAEEASSFSSTTSSSLPPIPPTRRLGKVASCASQKPSTPS